jgi:hypothetical protein
MNHVGSYERRIANRSIVSKQPTDPIFSGKKMLYDYWDFLTLEDWIGCSETSVKNYHYTLRKIPEERRSHPLRGENPKSREISLIKDIVDREIAVPDTRKVTVIEMCSLKTIQPGRNMLCTQYN